MQIYPTGRLTGAARYTGYRICVDALPTAPTSWTALTDQGSRHCVDYTDQMINRLWLN